MSTIDTFGLVLPDDWVRFPIDTDEFGPFLDARVAELTQVHELSPTGRRQLELAMRQLAAECRRAGVRLAAAHLSPVATSPASNDVSILIATCVLGTMERHQLGSTLPLTAPILLAGAARRRPDAPDPGYVIAPHLTDIGGVASVRFRRLTSPSERSGHTMLSDHTLVPYDAGERCAVLTLSSPNPEHLHALCDVFDAIVDSFRMFGGDTPTDPRGASTPTPAEVGA